MGGFGVWNTTTDASVLSDLMTVRIVDDALSWTAARCQPNAVWDAEMGWTWVVFMRTAGTLWITYYDHATGEIATPVQVDTYPFAADDFHHATAVMLDAAGRVHIIWGGHLVADNIWHYRMDNPRDMSAWTAQSLPNGTYVYGATTDDGELLFTERAGDSHGSTFPVHEFGALNRCTDGSTWTRTAVIDTTGTPESYSDFYQRAAFWADGRFHILWTVARGTAHDGTWTNLYYAAFDPVTAKWFAADGTDLGTVINWTEHSSCLAATISNEGIGAALAWHRGAPAVAYIGNIGPSDLIVTIWDGSAWVPSDPLLTSDLGYTPRLVSTPDELLLIAHSNDATFATKTVDVWRYVDETWQEAGTLLSPGADLTAYHDLLPIYEGPAVAVGVRFEGGIYGDNDITRVGPLTLITRPLDELGDIAGAIATHNADPDAHPDLAVTIPNETVFAPDFTVTDGSSLDLDIMFVWGIDTGGDPYYNATGVTAGDEAVLVLNNDTGELSLRPVEV